jgi:hypothetical protein
MTTPSKGVAKGFGEKDELSRNNRTRLMKGSRRMFNESLNLKGIYSKTRVQELEEGMGGSQSWR